MFGFEQKNWQRDFFLGFNSFGRGDFFILEIQKSRDFHNLFQKSCLDFSLTFSYSEIYLFFIKKYLGRKIMSSFFKTFFERIV